MTCRNFTPPFDVVEMPLTKHGIGPASPSRTTKIVYQVWDASGQVAAVQNKKDKAIEICNLLNKGSDYDG